MEKNKNKVNFFYGSWKYQFEYNKYRFHETQTDLYKI